METLQRFLLVSAVVLFLFVFYQWLMRYLQRKEINDPFPYLFPFEKEFFEGQEILKFDMPYDSEVRAEVFAQSGERLFIAFDLEIKKGIHPMPIDFSSLPEGEYELKVSFPNQTLRRPIKVVHSK